MPGSSEAIDPPEPSRTHVRTIELALGEQSRRVCLSEVGVADGSPLIALHGTPGSRFKFHGAHAAAKALGIRIIAPDRWGYGGTEPPVERGLDRYGDDLAAIADALDIERFAILAVSGGGPFAAMAAARLGPRVTRLALVCPVGPLSGAALGGITWFHRFCFLGLPRIPGATRATFASYRWLLARAPDLAARTAASRAGPGDRTIMADAVWRRDMAAMFAEGLAPGTEGARIDMTLFSRPWEPSPLQVPTRMWLGLEDRNVPLAAARQLAALTAAEVIEKAGCGHYWIVQHWEEVLSWTMAGTP